MKEIPEQRLGNASLVEGYFREFEALKEEVHKRTELNGQIQLWATVFLAGLIPLSSYVESNTQPGIDSYLLLLFAAVVFGFLAWYQIDLENGVAEIGSYIAQELTPAIEKEIGAGGSTPSPLFAWERFWRKRYGTFQGWWLQLGLFGKYLVPVGAAIFLLLTYVQPGHGRWSPLAYGLVALIAFQIIWTFVSAILIGKKIVHATNPPSSGGRQAIGKRPAKL